MANTKMEDITGNLSIASEEARGLAILQQKMELHVAAVNVFWGKGHVWDKASSKHLPHCFVLCQHFILSRILRGVFTFGYQL